MDTMSFYIFYKEKAQKETMIYLHKKTADWKIAYLPVSCRNPY